MVLSTARTGKSDTPHFPRPTEGELEKGASEEKINMDCLWEDPPRCEAIIPHGPENSGNNPDDQRITEEDHTDSAEDSFEDCSDLESEDEHDLEREMALWRRIEKLRMKIESSHRKRIEKKVKKHGSKTIEKVLLGSFDFHHPPPPPPPTPSSMMHFDYNQYLQTAPWGNSHFYPQQERCWRRHRRGQHRVGPLGHYGPRFPFVSGGPHMNGCAYTRAVEASHLMPPPPPPPYPGYGPFHQSFHTSLSPAVFRTEPNQKNDILPQKTELKNDSFFTSMGDAYGHWEAWHQHLPGADDVIGIKASNCTTSGAKDCTNEC